MTELTASDRAAAKLLAGRMNRWLNGTATQDPTIIWCPAGPGDYRGAHYHHADSRLVEWCRAARDVLEIVAVSGG